MNPSFLRSLPSKLSNSLTTNFLQILSNASKSSQLLLPQYGSVISSLMTSLHWILTHGSFLKDPTIIPKKVNRKKDYGLWMADTWNLAFKSYRRQLSTYLMASWMPTSWFWNSKPYSNFYSGKVAKSTSSWMNGLNTFSPIMHCTWFNNDDCTALVQVTHCINKPSTYTLTPVAKIQEQMLEIIYWIKKINETS